MEFLCSKGGVRVGLWKALKSWGHLISDNLSFVVGHGPRIKFRKDRWCGDTPLNVAFPSLFDCACAKEVWVWEICSVDQQILCWIF